MCKGRADFRLSILAIFVTFAGSFGDEADVLDETLIIGGFTFDRKVFECPMEPIPEDFYNYVDRIDNICANTSYFIAEDRLDEVDLTVKFFNKVTTENFKELYSELGSSVKHLQWHGSTPFKHSEIADIFELMPNLEFLELLRWGDGMIKFGSKSKKKGILTRHNLTVLRTLHLSVSGDTVLTYLSRTLPENVIQNLNINVPHGGGFSNQALADFFESQKAVKAVAIENIMIFPWVFKNLQLEKYKIDVKPQKSYIPMQRMDTSTILLSQPELMEIDLFMDHQILDDDLFQKICKMKNIVSLSIHIDGISSVILRLLERIRWLKTLRVRSKSFLEFHELCMSDLDVETLELEIDSLNAPEKSFQQLTKNFGKLKHLKIGYGVHQNLSFFLKNLPKLVTLDLQFGDTESKFSFDRIFEDGECIRHLCMKTLKIKIWKISMFDTKKFFKFLEMFPNLENLQFKSFSKAIFPFQEKFLHNLVVSLRNLRILELDPFDITCSESVTDQTVAEFRELAARLDSCSFRLVSIEEGADRIRYCLNKKIILRGANVDYSYGALIESLEDDYVIHRIFLTEVDTDKPKSKLEFGIFPPIAFRFSSNWTYWL